MNKKLIFSIFICIQAYSNLYSQINNYDNSICWEIKSSKTSKPSYILGSVHQLDTTKIYFPIQKVKELIDECGNYCTESVLDSTFMKELVKSVFLSNKKMNLRDSLGNEYYEKLIHIADSSKGRLKTFKPYLSIIKPGFIGFMVTSEKQLGKSTLHVQTNFKMDSYFEQYSTSKKYGIHGLESAQKTLDMITGSTYRESILTLKACIDEYYKQDTTDLIVNYASQNLKLLKESAYSDSSMVNRNKIMADGIDLLLQKKAVFIDIGVGHLPYEFGVLNLLSKKGYLLIPYYLDIKQKKLTISNGTSKP